MKRLLIFVVLCSLAMSAVGQEKPAPKSETKSADWKSGPPAADPPARVVAGRRELSLREARRLGITLSTVRGHMKDLRADGFIDETTSKAEISALVLERITEGDPKAFDEKAGVDLDTLLAFIEKLIDLLMKLFV